MAEKLYSEAGVGLLALIISMSSLNATEADVPGW